MKYWIPESCPNLVVVFARHLLIKDYSNEYTRNQVENHKQTTLILLYPEAHQDLGKDYYQLLDGAAHHFF